MPPTVHTGSSDRKQRPAEKKSEIVCRVKYCNTLPDIPFDPKFITYPFESNRFVQYKPTSLERNYKHDLLTEHDLGVTIDLINPNTYAIDPNELSLHAEDEKLLEEESLAPQDSKRSRHHNKIVPWLKKTEYISTEFNRYGHSSEKTETKVGYNVKKLFKEENLYMDRESQIRAINKTFEDAKKPIDKHYSKPGVVPLEILPVFPDFELWKYPFAQVMFDTDPAPLTQIEEMSQAMIRGVMDESGEQFVAYFLPQEETTKKRKRDSEEGLDYVDAEEYEYKMAREYNWNVKNKASKGYEENYFFVFRDGAVYYDELETRVRLSKRRMKPGVAPNNSRLVVRHRPLNEAEMRTQEVRMLQLEPPQDEEEPEITQNGEKEESDAGESEKEEIEEEGKQKDDDAMEEDEEEEEKEEEEEEEEKEEEEKEKEEEVKEDDEEEEDKKEDDNENESEAEQDSEKSAASSSASSAASSSSSESESEAEEEQKKRDEELIFGSDSD